MDDIVIDEEYVKAMAEYITKQGDKIEKYMEAYIDILGDIIKNDISQGATSEALKVYIEVAKAMQGMVAKTSFLGNTICQEFIADIEAADRF